jgi:hypothetical protein
MNIAILADSLCVDVAVFDDENTAEDFLNGDVWPDATSICQLPDGFGIGDNCVGGIWEKDMQSESTEEVENGPPAQTLEDRITFLEGIISTLLANE